MSIIELVRKYLVLDKTSKTFLRWKETTGSKKIKVGDEALTCGSGHYYRGSIMGVKVSAHQAVFILAYGYLPALIDHRDRNPFNCDPDNLRESNTSKNACNQGARGYRKRGNKFEAYFRREYLGLFATPEEAKAAHESRRLAYVGA